MSTSKFNARHWKHENGGIIKAQNGTNTYPVYGSQQKAKFAYDAGSRNPEAIGAAIPTRIGSDGTIEGGNIKNTAFTTIANNNGSSNTNFESKSTISYNDGLYNTSHVGNSNNNGVINSFEHHSFGMPNGDRYHTYNHNGVLSDRYEVNYAKRLEIDKLPKPKTLFEGGGILKAQEGTGNLYVPHPLSPVGIALNRARAISKGKTHLPPGVKEVVGPDGKKVAIRTEQPLVPLEQSIAEWLPGTGDVAEVGYIANDVKNGNYGSAALGAGLIFLPGNARKILDKYRFNKAVKNFNSTIDDIANTEHFGLLMDLSRSDEFVQQNLFQDPTDVKTIIHGDGAASGFNNPKKLTTVGHRELTSLKQLPHFEGGQIVPANTEISQPGGRVISAKEHPLFLSDTQPWYETAHNGETLKRYWGIDGENSRGLWEWIDKKGKMHIPTESPYRFITMNIEDFPNIKEGKFIGRRGSTEYELNDGIPIEKIKSGYEYDPVLKVWSRVVYKQ